MSDQQQKQEEAPRRQFVTFGFYKVDPGWRRLLEKERTKGKREFCQVVKEYQDKGVEQGAIVIAYSTVGIRGDVDFFLWRISYSLEALQEMSAKLFATGLGQWLHTPLSYLSMTKRSIYLVGHQHEGQADSRGTLVPGQYKYLFIYPFVKTRQWYLLTEGTRQGMMKEHIVVGHKYPRVKLNTTYSFGLDDQDFVVAFESDHPADFVDLVMELRASQGSEYTVRDTPIYTGVRGSMDQVLNLLGG